jgi:hypothetical protein
MHRENAVAEGGRAIKFVSAALTLMKIDAFFLSGGSPEFHSAVTVQRVFIDCWKFSTETRIRCDARSDATIDAKWIVTEMVAGVFQNWLMRSAKLMSMACCLVPHKDEQALADS